jgi:hypothetical protein
MARSWQLVHSETLFELVFKSRSWMTFSLGKRYLNWLPYLAETIDCLRDFADTLEKWEGLASPLSRPMSTSVPNRSRRKNRVNTQRTNLSVSTSLPTDRLAIGNGSNSGPLNRSKVILFRHKGFTENFYFLENRAPEASLVKINLFIWKSARLITYSRVYLNEQASNTW